MKMSLIFLFLHRWKKEAAVWNLAIRIAEVIRIVERNAYAARGVKPEILQKAKMELFRETKYPAFNTIIGFLQDRVIDPNWQYVVRKADHDSRFHEAESVYRICNTVALVPKDLDGVLAAGRCIGASGYAWEIFRVIPAAALTGEAAGIAAALCVENDLLPKELPYGLLKKELHSMP